VTDCGCFGDVIKLTPWTSFTKDIILLVLISFLFFQRNPFPQAQAKSWKFWTYLGSTVLCFAIGLHCIYRLPILDFLPYHVGASIPNNMKDSEEIKYKEAYFYTNLKTQKVEEFPKWEAKLGDTTTYKYKDYKKIALNPWAKAKITDYRVTDTDGNDVTQETFKGDKFLIILSDVKQSNIDALKKTVSLTKELEKTKIKPIVLTASDVATFEAFRHEFQLAVPYFFVDKTVLKTMVRANPGFIRLKEGTVLQKWHYFDLPKITDIQ
jgi:hypothetical protein